MALPEVAGQKSGADADWESVLADFEADLLSAQDRDTDEAPVSAPWNAPRDLGPLPARLAGRADRILRAQRQALIALQQAKEDTAKHLAALDAIPSVRPPLQSVYLDVEG
ncbi:hypothetical protein ACFWIX_02215 [Pseudarthrobacter sp. NPDC058362]|uniref:hypothetical protein n=1 Tax=unclassified Pseudarthrobacter TaxID=2647000 RepID=UPI0036516AAB